jgi:hypothetical protein
LTIIDTVGFDQDFTNKIMSGKKFDIEGLWEEMRRVRELGEISEAKME